MVTGGLVGWSVGWLDAVEIQMICGYDEMQMDALARNTKKRHFKDVFFLFLKEPEPQRTPVTIPLLRGSSRGLASGRTRAEAGCSL